MELFNQCTKEKSFEPMSAALQAISPQKTAS
jgi:hypothetical protein